MKTIKDDDAFDAGFDDGYILGWKYGVENEPVYPPMPTFASPVAHQAYMEGHCEGYCQGALDAEDRAHGIKWNQWNQ